MAATANVAPQAGDEQSMEMKSEPNRTSVENKLVNDLALREHLAAARTVLANERTFLAFQRTAVTELAAAITFIKFFDHVFLIALGWALLPVAVLTGYYGVKRYLGMRRLIREMEKKIL